MKCTQCNADNVASHKFCHACGTAMATMCDHCGAVNPSGDKYCGMCGSTLLESRGQEPLPPEVQNGRLWAGSGQYSARDIEELLALRTKMKKEEDSAESFRQDDIDNLFEQAR